MRRLHTSNLDPRQNPVVCRAFAYGFSRVCVSLHLLISLLFPALLIIGPDIDANVNRQTRFIACTEYWAFALPLIHTEIINFPVSLWSCFECRPMGGDKKRYR